MASKAFGRMPNDACKNSTELTKILFICILKSPNSDSITVTKIFIALFYLYLKIIRYNTLNYHRPYLYYE